MVRDEWKGKDLKWQLLVWRSYWMLPYSPLACFTSDTDLTFVFIFHIEMQIARERDDRRKNKAFKHLHHKCRNIIPASII